MNKETSSIQLPPPRKQGAGSRGRAPSGWIVGVFAALIAGLAAGLVAGKRFSDESAKSSEPERVASLEKEVEGRKNRQVEDLIQSARDAIDRADWVEIRDVYNDLKNLDPENPQLQAALPLINLHMDEALGGLVVTTIPDGATVKLGSHGEAKSRARFSDVPYGTYTMEVNLEGFEAFVTKVKIGDKSVRELEPIKLLRSSGSLTLSSEPNGVEFQLLRTDGLPNPQELEVIEIGVTPVLIEKLDPGEYQVNMALKGWPNFSEKISVEHNRKASVSHVFARGGLKITSDPDGAEIFLTTESSLGAKNMGTTPALLRELPVGRHGLELRYKDWPTIKRVVEVSEGEDSERDFSWPRAPIAFSSDPAGAEIWLNDRRVGRDDDLRTPFTMEFPVGDYTFVSRYENLSPVIEEVEITAAEADVDRSLKFSFEYGSIVIQSNPPGAAVLRDGLPLGRTPFSVDYVRPGLYSYQLSKAQHQGATVSGEVNPGQSLKFDQRLVFDPAPKTRSDFTNRFGLKMIWIDPLKGWVGAHEVSQRVFESLMNKNPSEFKGGDFPVHGVSWYDADKFCKLLSASEQGRGRLPKGYEYRMPSDLQWSEFVGQAKLVDAITSLNAVRGGPAKIGSTVPNEYGLFDVRGNVWEWCDDWYSQAILNRAREAGATTNPSDWVGTERKVLRGGSWIRSTENDLAVGYRIAYRPADGRREVGFRVVLMPSK